MQYLRNRFYDPVTAQFLTRDPAVEITGRPYGYAGDNPLKFYGRTGRDCESISLGMGGVDIATISDPLNPECAVKGVEETPEKLEHIAKSPAGGPLLTGLCLALIVSP